MASTQINKLLIANRGEIALRVIRSARAMGIKTVAVYSDVDALMPHVSAADQAFPIGAAEASASYLNIEAILTAARSAHADAVHPGYGFLSERPEFAEAVTGSGLTFVGPSAAVMRTVGDRIAARRLAVSVGVPVVPGLETIDANSMRQFAARVRYPVLIKAAAGGGGRGMRVVRAETEVDGALSSAASEAQAAFGDGRLFIEKYLERPRHIEVQVVGGGDGKVVAFGERECSIQRRHQKIVEESPAPALSEELRQRIIDCAVKLTSAAAYQNAGTVEFLVEGDNFYFLEINARLQVEHPVTELRFGCDLVEEQLRVAMGAAVRPPAAPRGHAIECRINAEDPDHDFRPATGTVKYLRVPGGPGIRFDSFLAPGAQVSPYYDGLLGKLISWGQDREQARRRMVAALDEFMLLGCKHNAAFLRQVINSEDFAAGRLSTHFLEDNQHNWHTDQQFEVAALVAAALAGNGFFDSTPARSANHEISAGLSPWTQLGGFVLWGGRR